MKRRRRYNFRTMIFLSLCKVCTCPRPYTVRHWEAYNLAMKEYTTEGTKKVWIQRKGMKTSHQMGIKFISIFAKGKTHSSNQSFLSPHEKLENRMLSLAVIRTWMKIYYIRFDGFTFSFVHIYSLRVSISQEDTPQYHFFTLSIWHCCEWLCILHVEGMIETKYCPDHVVARSTAINCHWKFSFLG